MARYALYTQSKSNIDGYLAEQGEAVGVLETDRDLESILSMVRFRQVAVEPIDDSIVVNSKQELAPVGNLPTDPTGFSADELNAMDAAEDARLAAEAAAKVASGAESSIEPEITGELLGLKARVAKILQGQKLTTKAETKAWVANGGDLLAIEGIGKTAASEVTEWMNS